MYYQEPHRPQIHFTPKENWINDPNGLVYFEGEYHLFYQRNPYGNDHDHMHWGHAVSSDLFHWEELDIALAPDELGTIFSGSAVVDKDNTSGLFEEGSGGLVAIFTHDGQSQQQSIAYSSDKGRTWKKYIGNPVIENTTIKDFRDPKVFWHKETEKWMMVLACGDHIQIYGSPNLIDWEYLSSFGKEYPSHEGVWECPDLVCLPIEGTDDSIWVLIVSMNEGGPNGGSAVQYFTGSFDGIFFRPNEQAEDPVKWADEGKDFYAAITWDNTAKTYWIGWMNNWEYAGEVPVSPWRSSMSLVRTLTVQQVKGDYLLKQTPVIPENQQKQLQEEPFTVQPSAYLEYEIKLPVTINVETKEIPNSGQWGFRLISDQEEIFTFHFDQEKDVYFFSRTAGILDFSKDFSKEITGSLKGQKVKNIFSILDQSSVEIFVNDGLSVSTNLFYPRGSIEKMQLYTEKEEVPFNGLSLEEYQSIWK
ncbi:glycoside hydrolase family 32 protein [Gracilibacillus sp. S3-1-1]|uniref:Glycoside hydrolase family 32 protein n=1 Tax=Gracilibacillus pellucidus TaxID=3095368 RepID=A0ACC6M2W1_9BACI|nr:glycoside hydrolase family 32 protein [Gracilibacillus sp. S3-1-1]MDX8045296.1 glycoside hydrolase family 32 protein [Gracilibacillus sp. S3-1-1]